ncbi:hypothetical protein [Paenibacillus sp. Root444D2]|uniref:hypothetical protein n=1 Tax=Paenibacillus sp. Root444D2 TaxID=1736538 RepID=UPI001F2B3101|nr:hypothetical protein [Paenibacillus sp. Root444D2]
MLVNVDFAIRVTHEFRGLEKCFVQLVDEGSFAQTANVGRIPILLEAAALSDMMKR